MATIKSFYKLTGALGFQPAVTFSSDDSLRGSDGVIIPAGRLCTASGWVYLTSFSTPWNYIFTTGNSAGNAIGGSFELFVSDIGNVQAFGRTTDGGTVIFNWSTTGAPIQLNRWHHIMVSVDMNNEANTRMYIDDTEVLSHKSTFVTGDLEFQAYEQIGTYDSANHIVGDMSEVYFTDEWIDLSIQTNREKFIKFGRAINLGAQGELPTGNQARVYFSGTKDVWNTGSNKGTKNNITMTAGEVTDSTNPRVELP